jgi:GT2 family glycosyltransferase
VSTPSTTTVTASVVLYNTPRPDIEDVLRSLDQAAEIRHVAIVDNSPHRTELPATASTEISYLHLKGSNIGFGRAHNLAIDTLLPHASYHLILNADTVFEPSAITRLTRFMNEHPSIGGTMPGVRNVDASFQRLIRPLPTPYQLFARRFLPVALQKHLSNRKGLENFPSEPLDQPVTIPALSGCFMFVRGDALRGVGGFDGRFFMYMEDIDLSRRIAETGDLAYLPDAIVVHKFERASYKSLRALRSHISSALSYFNKWGWFFDSERGRLNRDSGRQL